MVKLANLLSAFNRQVLKHPSLFVIFCFLTASEALAEGNYLFIPKGSEFSVTFPSKPVIETIYTQEGELQRATLLLEDVSGFMRSEVLLYEYGAADDISDAEIVMEMHNYAELYGLINAEVRVVNGPIARCGYLKSNKRLKQMLAMYESIVCYGSSSMVMLYIGSRADLFPPPGGTTFMRSIKRLSY